MKYEDPTEDYEADIEYEWEQMNKPACWGEDKKPYRSVKECIDAGNKTVYVNPDHIFKDMED